MKFSQQELEGFYRFIDFIESNLEPTHACVVLKVFYYYMQNPSTTIRFQLQPGVLERLEQRNYAEYDSLVYENLRRFFRIMGEIAQERDDR
ncbi:hypothetical protein M3647_21115 [Paenibacillus cellulositrophicus]|uniref:hypothetical protein n=1 Tax=Paenibacillus cellulositrophicus TaxID=562959 RepID=UPI00203F7F00|nr:hypothetical protein [Paenibacillus cellulositrophicus]MCM2999979.1 hypothetical protein [Paenibacillus cellulositrophicus]